MQRALVRLALACGAAKAKFTNQSMLRSAMLMLLNGKACPSVLLSLLKFIKPQGAHMVSMLFSAGTVSRLSLKPLESFINPTGTSKSLHSVLGLGSKLCCRTLHVLAPGFIYAPGFTLH